MDSRRKFFFLGVFASLLALCAVGAKEADAACLLYGHAYCDTRAEAEALVVSHCVPQTGWTANGTFYNPQNAPVLVGGAYYVGTVSPRQSQQTSHSNCPTNGKQNTAWWRETPLNNCADDQPFTYQDSMPRSEYSSLDGESVCVDSCGYSVTESSGWCVGGANGSGGDPDSVCLVSGTASPTGQACSGTEEPAPPEAEDRPDGWVCDEATGQCVDPDGEPQYCTFNPDGSRSTCVPRSDNRPVDGENDADGDGTPDEDDVQPGDAENGGDDGTGNETDNTASGGMNCEVAPIAKGDGILANALYQQWKTRCELEKLNAKADAGELGGDGEGSDANGNGQPDWTETTPGDPAAGSGAGDTAVITDTPPADLDGSGWLGSTSCPTLPSAVTSIGTFLGETPEAFCMLVGWILTINLVCGAFAAARILAT